MLSRKDIMECLNERADFIMKQLPRMETWIKKIEDELFKFDVNLSSNKINYEKILGLYLKIVGYYHNTLDTVRKYSSKIIISDDDSYALYAIRGLTPEKKKMLFKYLDELKNNKV
jgi:hypothetical protein